MKKPSLKLTRLSTWYADQKEKEKKRQEERKKTETFTLKMTTFVVTLVAMSIGMSIVPLFPSPLPIFLAVLVAFLVYQYPQVGMPIGGAVIGLGLLYNLAQLHFISYLGTEQTRVGFVVAYMALFICLPIAFNRYKGALAIDLGIIAVAALSSQATYFLAIPLLFASAVYFKRNVALSVVYYGMISVPLQIVQYFKFTVLPISLIQSDWWNAAGSAPPLFVSLSQIFGTLGSQMTQFRLYDTSQILDTIAGQLTWIPNEGKINVGSAITQYLDSAPGLIMFLIIVVGLAMGMVFFTRLLIRTGSGGLTDRLMPIFTATITTALFFILMGSLSGALAFSADASPGTLILGTLATLMFTVPVAFMNTTPQQTATPQEILDRLHALIAKAGALGQQVANVKASIPVTISGPAGKIQIIQDSLDDTLRRSEAQLYDPAELDKKYSELKTMDTDIDNVDSELNAALAEYQILVNCEYANWVGRLRDIGLDVSSNLNADYLKAMTLEERVDAIKQTLEAGRKLAKDAMQTTEPIYFIVRSLYDPTLPEKSRAIEFSNQKIESKESPWIAIEALYNALNNMSRQYGSEIQTSMRYLKNSLAPIANLSNESYVLPLVFGDRFPRVVGYARKAESMKQLLGKKIEKEKLSIVDVIALKDDIQTFIAMANDVLSMLYTELVNEEDTINRLLPTKEYLWETNSTLRERLKKAVDVLSNPSNYKINQIMENLPKSLAYVDETVQTLAIYWERREFLLNYPTAEAAIEEQLKTKDRLTPKDLPFQPKFGGEYLRLYYSQRFSDFAFDKDSAQLSKKN